MFVLLPTLLCKRVQAEDSSPTQRAPRGSKSIRSLHFLSLCAQKEAAAAEEDVMATGELNPNHYPAQRAAKLVQHYLNARYGSPYKLFGLKEVHSGNAEVRFIFAAEQQTFHNLHV